MNTNPTNVPRAEEIARAVLEAAILTNASPQSRTTPVTVTELYHLDADDPREPERYILAMGHNYERTLELASAAPHFGRGLPDAVVIETPGSAMANIDADPNDPHQITTGDQVPCRAARVIAMTLDTIGGAIAVELTAGFSPTAFGPHDPDSDDPHQIMATALWSARRTTDRDQQRIKERLRTLLEADDDVTPEQIQQAIDAAEDLTPTDPRPRWKANRHRDTQ